MTDTEHTPQTMNKENDMETEMTLTPEEQVALLAEREELLAGRDELQSDLQRVMADFSNHRKRVARDQEQQALAANQKIVTDLLVVLDDLERALAHTGENPDATMIAGVQMTHDRLKNILTLSGVTEINTDGEFDPHLHEAVLQQAATEEHPEGTIITVYQRGYELGNRVLRAAKVVVAG